MDKRIAFVTAGILIMSLTSCGMFSAPSHKFDSENSVINSRGDTISSENSALISESNAISSEEATIESKESLSSEDSLSSSEDSGINVGDIFEFGHYEQDNDIDNGAEPIRWRILAISGDELTVISEKGLDAKPYNETYADVTWETCTLRSWLNYDFYGSAFSSNEKSMIKTTHRENPDNPSYGTEGGNATDDKVWLLTYDEAKAWFSSNAERQCNPTAYAETNGASETYAGYCDWWLSTPGDSSISACYVSYDGNVGGSGYGIFGDRCVRPALTIKLGEMGPHEHWFGEWETAKEASHTQEGEESRVCECGERETRPIAKTEAHEFGEWETTKAATPFENGEKQRVCICGEKETKSYSPDVGDILEFGHYEQDNDIDNGTEPITWRVLAKSESELTVISEKGLDCKKYNETYVNITWETCTLRSWLNSDFYGSSFSSDEKSKIKMTHRENPDNTRYGVDGGNATDDKMWLLTYNEANTWFSSDDDRLCKPTAYAKSNGAYESYDGYCYWWLSTPGIDSDYASYVNFGGWAYAYGSKVNQDIYCVRPALTIAI